MYNEPKNKTYYAKHSDLVPDKYMKQFTRDYLPNNVTVTDLDLAILSSGGCLRFIEYKCRGDKPKFAQRFLYRMVSNVIHFGLAIDRMFGKFREGSFNIRKIYKPLFISFENTNFDDGKAWINDKLVTKLEAIKMMRFGNDCCKCFPGECKVCNN